MSGSDALLAGAGLPLAVLAGLLVPRRGSGAPVRLALRMVREALSVRRRRQTAAAAVTAVLLTGSGLARVVAVAARVADLALERIAAATDGLDEPDEMGMPGRLRRWRAKDRKNRFEDRFTGGFDV